MKTYMYVGKQCTLRTSIYLVRLISDKINLFSDKATILDNVP